MNREFNPTSTLIRALFATASLLVSGLVVGSVVSLADHYSVESQMAGSGRTVVAQH